MRDRTRISAGAALIGTLILSGCTGTAPEPSDSAEPSTTQPAARCSPDNTRVRWHASSPTERKPMGYRIVTADASGLQEVSRRIDSYQSTGSLPFADDPGTPDAEWVDFLIDDLNREESPDRYGSPELNVEGNTVSSADPGEYVVLYHIEQQAFPFTFECGCGAGEGTGTLVTSKGGPGVTLANCAGGLDPSNPLVPTLEEACATGAT